MRASTAAICAQREQKSGVIFITGANGFVGSHIAASLRRDGFKIMVLCRHTQDAGAAARIGRVMAWHGLESDAAIEVIDGDVGQPLLGLSEATFSEVAGRLSEIIHCASNTSFVPERKAEIEHTNIDGTRHVLELARAGSCTVFHHISTAYVGGKGWVVCPERIEPADDYNNFYEFSKSRAEQLVIDACAQAGIRAAIYRPSIIIGDSVSGRTLIFNALYYPIKVFYYLRDLFREDFANNRGRYAAEMGVTLHEDGSLHIPLRLEQSRPGEGNINLVPIDYVVQAFRAIMAQEVDGGIYHLVNKQPSTLETLVGFAQEFIKLSGLQICGSEAFAAKPMTALERQVDSFVKVYKPYMSDTRRFETARADAVLEPSGVTCPVVDYPLFVKCMTFAVEQHWQNPLKPRAKTGGLRLATDHLSNQAC